MLKGIGVLIKSGSSGRLIKESKDFSSSLLPSSLLVVHYSESSGEDNVSETTRRKNVLYPLLYILDGNIEARGEDAALVDASDQLDNDLS